MIKTTTDFTFKTKTITLLIAFMLSATLIKAQIFIEAENFSSMLGIETQTTWDDGGGENIGWFDKGDWMEYELNIPTTGDYNIDIRIASELTGTLELSENGNSLLSVNITTTGGWQDWETITSSTSINFTAGSHTLKVQNAAGGFNLNWFSLSLTNPADNDKPSKPEITESKSSIHDISLVWSISTDATTAVAGYKILRDNKLFAHTSENSLKLTKLAPNQEFNLGIVATDIAGNISDTSTILLKTDTISWVLQWSDEFDYTGKPDPNKWLFETGGGGWGNGEYQYYTNGDNANVENGALVIEARKETLGSNDFTSSRINSIPEVDFMYGRIEVKAKLPSTKGSWPAIWTLPTDWIYGSWPACGEIDIMEHSIMTGYGYVFGTVHTGAYNHSIGTQKSGGIQLADVTNAYHTYTIEWYPDHIDWYVDDILIFTFENEYKTTDEWPYDIPHHLILNVAIGGGLGGEVDYNGVWPQQMIIDYVRVYDFKLNENDTIAPEDPTGLTFDPKWSTIDFTWDMSKDNYAIKHYNIFVDDELIDSVNGTNYLVEDLLPLTEYNIGVQACDYAGNVSKQVSSTVSTVEIAGIEIPGKIEAEDYTQMEGIQLEDCTDEGGGQNVAYIDAGDWLSYTIDVKEDIEFKAGFRLASQSTAGSITFTDEADNDIATIDVPVTGGWQNWETAVSETFTLPLGIQTVKITANSKDFNINWIEIKAKDDFVGIAQTNVNPLIIYPNPSNGNELNIKFPDKINKGSLSLYSIDGQLINRYLIEGELELYRLSGLNLNTGVYLIQVIANQKVYTQTFEVK